jgi:hypothetical protein
MRRWNQLSAPMSHSKDWTCRSSRLGTSSGSRIFANETRRGAPGMPEYWEVELAAAVVLVARETAKMRPSKQGAAGGAND